MRITTKHHRTGRRRGSLLMAEFVLVAPVLLTFFLGIFEFYLMVATRIDMLEAARGSCRAAASGGYTFKSLAETEADKTGHAILGTGRLSRLARIHITWSQDLKPEQKKHMQELEAQKHNAAIDQLQSVADRAKRFAWQGALPVPTDRTVGAARGGDPATGRPGNAVTRFLPQRGSRDEPFVAAVVRVP